jgi:hypothetical protein
MTFLVRIESPGTFRHEMRFESAPQLARILAAPVLTGSSLIGSWLTGS